MFYPTNYGSPAARHRAFSNLPVSSTQPDLNKEFTDPRHVHERHGRVVLINVSGTLSRIRTDAFDEFWVPSTALTPLAGKRELRKVDHTEVVGRLEQWDGEFYINLLAGKELAAGARAFSISRTARVQNQWVAGQSLFYGTDNEPNAELKALGL